MATSFLGARRRSVSIQGSKPFVALPRMRSISISSGSDDSFREEGHAEGLSPTDPSRVTRATADHETPQAAFVRDYQAQFEVGARRGWPTVLPFEEEVEIPASLTLASDPAHRRCESQMGAFREDAMEVEPSADEHTASPSDQAEEEQDEALDGSPPPPPAHEISDEDMDPGRESSFPSAPRTRQSNRRPVAVDRLGYDTPAAKQTTRSAMRLALAAEATDGSLSPPTDRRGTPTGRQAGPTGRRAGPTGRHAGPTGRQDAPRDRMYEPSDEEVENVPPPSDGQLAARRRGPVPPARRIGRPPTHGRFVGRQTRRRAPAQPLPSQEMAGAPTDGLQATEPAMLGAQDPRLLELEPEAVQEHHTDAVAGREQLTEEELLGMYKRLTNLPEAPLKFPHPWDGIFKRTVNKLAARYNAEPTVQHFFDILAFPKVAFIPGMAGRFGSGRRAQRRVSNYPDNVVPRMRPPAYRDGQEGRAGPVAVQQAVQAGRFSRAANLLSSPAPPLACTASVVADLQAKHPTGRRNPFGQNGLGPRIGETVRQLVTATEIDECAAKFSRDTAAGPSGWTVPMLRLALQTSAFQDFFATLVGQIQQGTAPCRSFLTAAKLIAIPKKPSGLRPIAIGEIFYRCAMKAILRKTWTDGSLLPYQLGVGSVGGVEPVVRFFEKFQAGVAFSEEDLRGLTPEPGQDRPPSPLPQTPYTHVVSLDFSNAFNSVHRSAVAWGVYNYARPMYRMAKWAYNEPSPLLLSAKPRWQGAEEMVDPIGDERWYQELVSSEGVRQGDPLGPAFFSLAIRESLEDLSLELGAGHQVMAYLDDIYIFGTGPGLLGRAEAFFASQSVGLQLNVAKCREWSREEVAREGLPVLGSFVGPLAGRRDFLEAKMTSQVARVMALRDVNLQTGFLLLYRCLQGELRHLARGLDPRGLQDLWQQLDKAHYDYLRFARASEHELPTDKYVFSLPHRLGGLGITELGPLVGMARQAMIEMADMELRRIIEQKRPSRRPISQRQLTLDWHYRRQDQLASMLNRNNQRHLIDSCSAIGGRWLQVAPVEEVFALDDFTFSANLARRTFAKPLAPFCPRCALPNLADHAEICRCEQVRYVARHTFICRRLQESLQGIHGTNVTLEPMVDEGDNQLRADLRILGTAAPGAGFVNIDVSIVCPTRARGERVPPLAVVGGPTRDIPPPDLLAEADQRDAAAEFIGASHANQAAVRRPVGVPADGLAGAGLLVGARAAGAADGTEADQSLSKGTGAEAALGQPLGLGTYELATDSQRVGRSALASAGRDRPTGMMADRGADTCQRVSRPTNRVTFAPSTLNGTTSGSAAVRRPHGETAIGAVAWPLPDDASTNEAAAFLASLVDELPVGLLDDEELFAAEGETPEEIARDTRPSHPTDTAYYRPRSYPEQLIEAGEEVDLPEERGRAADALGGNTGPPSRSALGLVAMPPNLLKEDLAYRKFLWRVADRKVRKYAAAQQRVKPFILSTGGSLDKSAADMLRFWKGKMTKTAYKRLIDKMGMGLARARAEGWVG